MRGWSGSSGDRVGLMRVALLLAAVIWLGRLAWVQALAREHYYNPTGIAYTKRSVISARKGELRDRSGRVLARSSAACGIYVNPQMVVDPVAGARALAPLLDEPIDRLQGLLAKRLRRALLRSDATAEAIARIQPLIDQGIVELGRPMEGVRLWTISAGPEARSLSPAEIGKLSLLLGHSEDETRRALATSAARSELLVDAEAATAEQIQALALPGIDVRQEQQAAGTPIYLLPSPQAIDLPVDSGDPVIKPEVWSALRVLWPDGERPSPDVVARRLKVYSLCVRRGLQPALGEAIKGRLAAEGIEYVSIAPEVVREYPQGELMHSLLGGVDPDGTGTGGLELTYNQLLTGTDGWSESTMSGRGRPILQERNEVQPPRDGLNVELTIDATIQSYAEEAVQGAVDEFDGDWGLAVVADPVSGEILALADRANAKRKQLVATRTLGTPYEPGSILKPVVVAAALESGVTTPNDSFYCAGGTTVGNRHLSCIKSHGPETTYGAVRDSCNMVMIKLSERLGQAKLEPFFQRFGLMRRTGLGLASQETKGDIFNNNPEDRWGLLKTATVSYGKGIQTSSVGIVRAYATLLNGGVMPELHLVRRLLDRQGHVVNEVAARPGERVVSEKTAQEVQAMLRGVIADKMGTGKIAASRLYDLGGKTGTSVAYGGRGNRVVSMIGYGPHPQARLVVLVSVCEPRLGFRWGGSTCGVAMRTILDRSLQYLGVPALPGAAAAEAAEKAKQAEREPTKPEPKPGTTSAPSKRDAAEAER